MFCKVGYKILHISVDGQIKKKTFFSNRKDSSDLVFNFLKLCKVLRTTLK